MTNIKDLKAEAKSAFENGDYSSTFQTIWSLGVDSFWTYSTKADSKNDKVNWITNPNSGEHFWNVFVLTDEVFHGISNSDFSDDFLHCYFSKWKKLSPEFEKKLVAEYPHLFIKAVRVNQLFLKKDKINYLCSLTFEKPFAIHQKVWQKISETDSILWQRVDDSLANCKNLSLSKILSYCIIYLEEQRFSDDSTVKLMQLAAAYSMFVELISKSIIGNGIKRLNTFDFQKRFIEVLDPSSVNTDKYKRYPVYELLDNISRWIVFKEAVIVPYSFDLTIEPELFNANIYIKTPPEDYYNWKLNGVRYELNKFQYELFAGEIVNKMEEEGFLEIPGKNTPNYVLNQILAGFQHTTHIIMDDLGFRTFKVGAKEVNFEDLLNPLITYSFNRANRYELTIQKFKKYSKCWQYAYSYLLKESIELNVAIEAYFLMTTKEYSELNRQGIPASNENYTTDIIKIFGYEPSSVKEFNRHTTSYDVWQKPFLKMGDYLFCPMMFFANNFWFYSFVQTALMQYNKEDRKGTLAMEENLANALKGKGWTVKLLTESESSILDGDIDIFVEDDETTLYIQLKRTFFRLNLKDAYFESVTVDKKAVKQLNKASEFLINNKGIFTPKHNPIKWIVTTSYENVGKRFSGCFKANFFDILFSIRYKNIVKLKDLVEYIEKNMLIKDFIAKSNDNEIPEIFKMRLDEIFMPIKIIFEPKEYHQLIFSEKEGLVHHRYDIFDDAVKLYAEGNNNEAIKKIYNYIYLLPNDGEAYSLLANIYADTKHFEQAIIAFIKALELLPDDPFIIRDYFLCLLEAGKSYEGLVLALDFLEKYPFLGDVRVLFLENYSRLIKIGFLSTEQIIAIENRRVNLNL
jgi:hypothetical protein